MGFFRRKLPALLAALAIFVVGTTCTSAGCVLPSVLTQPFAHKQMSCCAERSDQHKSDGKPTHCPTCDQPISNSTIEKAATAVHPEITAGFLALEFIPVASTYLAPIDPAVAPAIIPAVGPPTLIHLHCALLI